MSELKVERLHLRDYRAIRALDLPEDGLGWKGAFPDIVMVGGGNGSGKTTLLNSIVTAFRGLREGAQTRRPAEGRMDVVVSGAEPQRFSYIAGTPEYTLPLFEADNPRHAITSPLPSGVAARAAPSFGPATRTGGPRVLFVQSPRDLVLPVTPQKMVGRLERAADFFHFWNRPEAWSDSAEALLYEARWLDLNAKEEGRADEAANFNRYADAFSSLLPGRSLIWRGGELVVQVAGSDVHHTLSAMSSGEKQILVLLADLLLHWTPGSVVLIDEPELHLHPSLQLRFYEALVQWRKERGGQLWLATQSTELFSHAADGTKVLLGAGSLL